MTHFTGSQHLVEYNACTDPVRSRSTDFAFLLLLLLASASGAMAEEASAPAVVEGAAEPAGYREAIDAALTEHAAQHFAESRALFERAHALYPNARTLRGMDMAEFELRNYVVSVRLLERALVANVKPLPDTMSANQAVTSTIPA